MRAGTNLHLTLCAVVHLLKEHGNSRSEISNVSISFSHVIMFNLNITHLSLVLNISKVARSFQANLKTT